MAVDNTPGANQAYRMTSQGVFQPLGMLASAVLPLNSQEILCAGPPTSGSFSSTIRRSSNGGVSFTTVFSFTPLMSPVHAFHQVTDTTLLVSTTSGGIWRSTNAGSTWALTWSISGTYHIRCFFEPEPGTIWGGTGADEGIPGSGAHIWESLDSGLTWAPRHTIFTGSYYFMHGLAKTGDGEYLAATTGVTLSSRLLARSKNADTSSSTWSIVMTGTSFTNLVHTSSDHLLFGTFDTWMDTGGSVYRSLDFGSSWYEDAHISKQGNIMLFDNQDGTLDAFTSGIQAGPRTDRLRNYTPNDDS